MQRTPPKGTDSPASQPAKRSHTELSPETTMETNDLIKLIRDTINKNLDEKLKELPTKADIEEIKVEIGAVNSEVTNLRLENKQLKEELDKVKKESDENIRDLNWLQHQIQSRNIFIRGLNVSSSPTKEVITMFKDKLEISPKIRSARKIFENNGKMTVIVEMETAISIQDVLKNTRKLAGTDIYIERDIIPKKQQMKKVSLLLKKKILAISKKHKSKLERIE